MSFQAYLDTIEDRTGLTPRQLLEIAHDKGLDQPGAKAGDVVAWFAADYGLGRGHAMALWHVLSRGPGIAATHVGTTGPHADESDTLWLDGKASNPAR
ncbi:DUF4287 domain-containing protein [Cellulomonas chengniuliangii]|uniref:DUF4287 domain-containing protein n=1 Tax=Cellulomonas chengniuliangii TaxID=2968084 RepID=A0ABY5KXS9_9CELL|nr:DUF4287 domain-containing protein [Cellulomonas chengniuliangii]MCC2308657.1 DUF4287 domain-containing protein [Cellulomonas chengniuliangii]MCC2317674.1 DUF4287 domain-containing protein [Cellulomonas chengniuliangii]UUI74016.1 DUF4287 domain-containing protein [Cellulomonas chengniuliangii]